MPIGEKIKAARLAKRLTLESVSQLLGVSRQAISQWEKNETIPDIKRLPDISRILGIPIGEITPHGLLTNHENAITSNNDSITTEICIVSVSGVIAAGRWQRFDRMDAAKHPPVPVRAKEKFAGYAHHAWETCGNDMPITFPNVSALVGVLFKDLGRGPIDGEIVILQRREGERVELSCRRCKLIDGVFRYITECETPSHENPIVTNDVGSTELIQPLARVTSGIFEV